MLTTSLRPNRYAKPCISCGRKVEAGAGFLVPRQSPEGGWDVVCATDAEGAADKPEMKAVETPKPRFRGVEEIVLFPEDDIWSEIQKRTVHHVEVKAANGQSYRGVQPGIYTMEYPDGHHRTFRVRVQESDAKFAPGKAILEYLRGPNNEADYEGFAFIEPTFRLQVWKRYRDAESEAVSSLLRDANEFTTHPERAHLAASCIRCNATLTTPESIAAGIGPTCASKGW